VGHYVVSNDKRTVKTVDIWFSEASPGKTVLYSVYVIILYILLVFCDLYFIFAIKNKLKKAVIFGFHYLWIS